MAFDFSDGSIFPSHSSPEESFWSSFKFSDCASPKDWDRFDPFVEGSRSSSPELEKSGDRGTAKADDIADQLPADPFDMEIRSTFTAITGWIEDFEDNFVPDFGDFEIMEEAERQMGDHHGLFTEFNMVWNEASGYMKIDGKSIPYDTFTGFLIDNDYNCEFVDDGSVEEFLSFGRSGNRVATDEGCSKADYMDGGAGGDPPDGLEFALHYVGVKELFTLERVCRSLRDTIRTDCLLWRYIHIDWPLSARITDDALVQLTSRAQGALECLSLVECRRVTDRGIKRVLETNPKLTKLSVPGCTRLTIEGILFNLRTFTSTGAGGIKHLRIGGISEVTEKQFEEMKLLLGADKHEQKRAHKPQFYRARKLNFSSDDDRAIDIELCPRCESVKLVYDCPVGNCQKKVPSCRACTTCIGRCMHCGRCIKDCDYEETFCLDLLCLDCWKKILKLQETPEENGASSSKCTIFHQETRYRFHLYG